MRCIAVLSAVIVHLGLCYGKPGSQGVGAFAYQDTSGNRYGGTYGLKDGKLYGISGDDVTTFGPEAFQGFEGLDSFFPEYFRNFENILQEAFFDQLQHQRIALDAARKAFDLTSNQAGYTPNFDFDSRFGGYPGFGQGYGGYSMPGFGGPSPFGGPNPFGIPSGPMGPYSAFAGAMAAPGLTAHKITLNPANPQHPNVDVQQMSDPSQTQSGGPQFYSVSSSSFASSSNVNGVPTRKQGGETVVNNNGVVTRYKV